MKLYLQYTIPYVSGDTRKGKSFLLNFLIRYLESGGAEDWLDKEPEKPLEGFGWRSVIFIFIPLGLNSLLLIRILVDS
jgi:hypothetical protein